ncbi:MAG: PAAR domain-containing protein [Marinobacterium sp.]|nr:PAAR domain-containing protein [Marinobacterium sp.]
MGKPVTRATADLCTGHGPCPPRLAEEGSPNVHVNSLPANCLGHAWAEHCKHKGYSASGSGTVFVNSRPLVRVGDDIDCGSKSAQGSPNVHAGG